ncbi:Hypothetical predicted protein [Marmota monax]|uniref:Uncharacterized protein n=1 Tax=Marmota monax TaxID=9995 RepID=A0A5E4A0M4_MARMO|nr:Hypothetical predicted protein [Marmota monax]
MRVANVGRNAQHAVEVEATLACFWRGSGNGLRDARETSAWIWLTGPPDSPCRPGLELSLEPGLWDSRLQEPPLCWPGLWDSRLQEPPLGCVTDFCLVPANPVPRSRLLTHVFLLAMLSSQAPPKPVQVEEKPLPIPVIQQDTEAEKQLIREEYEERLARLKADYEAEQESRARLEEDITAMRNSYDMKLSTLEENLRKETGGHAHPL